MKRIGPTTILAILFSAAPASADDADRAPGLVVRLYDIGQMVRAIPELAESQLPNEVRIAPTIDLRAADGGFGALKDNFYTEVDGFLRIEAPGGYFLRLMSDDGGKLWIDGELLIDHDGLHGPDPKDARIRLEAGTHALKIRHFEAGGGEQLTLMWRRPVEAEFTTIPPALLSHEKRASRETAPGRKKIIPPLRRGLPGDGTPVAGEHPSFRARGPVEREPQGSGTLDGRFCAIDDQIKSVREPPWAWLPPADAPGGYFSLAGFPGERFVGQLRINCAAGESKRIYVDPVDGTQQGCVFRFGVTKQVIEALDRLVFEMRAVRAMTNGFEIEFTKPLDPRAGWDPESYYIEQWPFDVAGGAPPKRDGIRHPVESASVSADRTRVFLEIANLKPSHVVYIRLLPPCISEASERPWSTEAWYTLNAIPQSRYGNVLKPPEPEPANFLTDAEQRAGWRLLFDGASVDAAWRGYRKPSTPDGWQARSGALVRVGPAGDLISRETFANFELSVEWRISAGGNSGIFWRVNEQAGPPYETGPEMQVLDNSEHHDGKNTSTSAGAEYALYEPVRDATAPVGLWNRVRIRVDGAHVTYSLNDERIVEYDLWSDDWKQRVARSKFKAWPGYGMETSGHIVLQDHGDRVWYRNLKIRELRATK